MKVKDYFSVSILINVLVAASLATLFVSAFILHYVMIIVIAGCSLLLVSTSIVICIKRMILLVRMKRKLADASAKGLATAIELSFDVPKNGELASISRSLNFVFNETKRVFWDIRENLFETKIHYSILEKMKLVMVSYMQKVVNIGNVRSKLDTICSRIGDTTSSVRAIMGSIIDLANKTDEEAIAIAQASDVLEKLYSVIGRITDISSENSRMANELEHATRMGGERVDETLRIIRRLDEGAGEMLSVIGIIDDIAESTNLLSINAGIEAAHTGIAGKGFRVIANEIMKLVVSTKKNAGFISSLLKEQVRNIGVALKESSASGIVFKNVNTEVEGAVRTWSDISENIAEMARDTKLLRDATERLTGITKVVAESSSVLRSCTEKIEKEITDLDKASDETADILAKITTEGSEEQKSTFEVLQQLGKVTKFVVNLNKAIDFFNVGKKIFFLFPGTGMCKSIMTGIVEEEYEVFQVDNYKLLPKLLRESSNSIVFINHENMPGNLTVDEIIQAIGKKTSVKNILVFSLVFADSPSVPNREEGSIAEGVVLSRNSMAENEKTILTLLEKHKAKGLRRYIRVECPEKDNVKVKDLQSAGVAGSRVFNVSSSAILFERKGNQIMTEGKKSGELLLCFGTNEYRVSYQNIVEKDENTALLVLNLKGNVHAKQKIYSYIYERLQEKLAEEIAMIRD